MDERRDPVPVQIEEAWIDEKVLYVRGRVDRMYVGGSLVSEVTASIEPDMRAELSFEPDELEERPDGSILVKSIKPGSVQLTLRREPALGESDEEH